MKQKINLFFGTALDHWRMLILFVVCFCQVLAGYENIYFGQSTWMAYTAMNRIYKYYDFNIKELASKKTSFSSYPG